jgi:hypothetical protein
MTTAGISESRVFRPHLLFACVQIALMLGSTIIPNRRLQSETAQLAFGFVVSQCVLAAMWAVLGPGRIYVRALGAPVWIVASAGLAGVFKRPSEAFWIILSCGVVTALAIAGVLGIARAALRVRLLHQNDLQAGAPFQYRLRHLFILMLITSLLLGIARWLGVARPALLNTTEDHWLVFLTIGSVWAVGILPLVFLTMAARSWQRLVVDVLAATLIAGVAGAVAGWVMVKATIPNAISNPLLVVGAVAYVGTLQGLLLRRWEGFRLARD